MERRFEQGEKVCLCRACKGKGVVRNNGDVRVCGQCGGSGRVVVSKTTVYRIIPYRNGDEMK